MPKFLAVWAALSLTSAAGADSLQWRQDFSAAMQEAKSSGKTLLINVHTSWCGPCQRMKQTTLKNPALQNLIAQRCVPLSLDGDANASLLQRLGVRAFPTQVFVSPDGQVLDRVEGFLTPDAYARAVQNASAKVGPSPAPSVARQREQETKPAAPARPPVIAKSDDTRSPGDPKAAGNPIKDPAVQPCASDTPLALNGYCPVSMIRKAELIEGKLEVCVGYGGRRYLFHTDAEKRLFERQPKKYLPVAKGTCLVSLLDDGKVRDGQVEWPALFDDEVYLFADKNKRRQFLDDPEKYVRGWRQASHRSAQLR